MSVSGSKRSRARLRSLEDQRREAAEKEAALTREQELVLFTLSTFAAKGGTRYELAERCGLDPDHIEDVLDELEELGFSKNTGEAGAAACGGFRAYSRGERR
jgi:DNA-binding MarR family transcriptional regulator